MTKLRERLKQGALANAGLNLEIAEEWFPVEQQMWQQIEQEESACLDRDRWRAVTLRPLQKALPS
jgi:hypothetical protein